MNIAMMILALFTFILFKFSSIASAQPPQGAGDESAMKDTVDLLKDRSKREELFKKDQKAKTANEQVLSVTNGNEEQTQELYNISADIFTPLMESVGNDPAKAMELLQKAQTNPEAFYKSLPPEVRAKIKGVSSQIEQSSYKKPQGSP